MKYIVEFIPDFEKDLKKLSKKHPSIIKDLISLTSELEQGQFKGDRIKGLKKVVYKTRLKSSDNKKGKSGGFRVIYELQQNKILIQLIQIYSKSKKANTTQSEIKKRLDKK